MKNTNIFQHLRNDHEKQRDLSCLLMQTHGKSEERVRLYRELKKEIEAHATVEEMTFYAELLRLEKTRERAIQCISEHKSAADLIEALDGLDMNSPRWLRKFAQLREELEYHMDEEEKEVFRAAEKALTKKRVEELGEEFDELKTAKI